jgi:hypothetical protein
VARTTSPDACWVELFDTNPVRESDSDYFFVGELDVGTAGLSDPGEELGDELAAFCWGRVGGGQLRVSTIEPSEK